MGNSFLVGQLNNWWETKPIDDKTLPNYNVAIVLGGISYYDTNLKRIHFQRSSDRIFHALALYKQGKVNKIFISGGAAYISKPYETEAIFLKEYLVKIGVPDSVVIIECKSRNTYENAVESKSELSKLGLFNNKQKFLLITSGYHMPRAFACYKKQGFNLDAFSVDGSAGKHELQLDELLIPNFNSFQNWDLLIHEWIGFTAYFFSGKI
jgi:uncharacterized SAM-binding protein YcdF (DUF218 family)